MKKMPESLYVAVNNGETDDLFLNVEKVENNTNDSVQQLSLPALRKKGLHYILAAFFLVSQIAGAGFLALPKAMAGGGWGSVVLTIFFCVSVGFSGTRLGRCWEILEERWPEYRETSRQPYMDIATRALGIHGRRFTLFCVFMTLVGSVIVFIILISEMMSNYVPTFNQCQWSLIVGGIVIPATWLGTPKDFWQASVVTVLATVTAVVIIVTKILIDRNQADLPVEYPSPTLTSFSLAFGAILFAFGGASVFPTVQNDMRNRSDFWKSVIIAFTVILAMYLPVQIIGYIFVGASAKSNILLNLNHSVVVVVAIVMETVNLLGTFLISFNPVAQSLEDITGVPSRFGWKRALLRSGLVTLEVLVALAIPDFGLVLNLIGGSTVACMSFILPPIMYLKLADDHSNPKWPKRIVSLLERIYLWLIVGVGVVGGISSTGFALFEIISPDSFKRSCLLHFL